VDEEQQSRIGRGDVMDLTIGAAVAVGAFILLLTYALLRIGVRIGVQRAIKNVVDGFFVQEEVLSEVEERVVELAAKIKNHDCWYCLFGSETIVKAIGKENRTREIGSALYSLSNLTGQLQEASMRGKDDHEADVRTDRAALRDVAWLADYGFRVWIAPNDNNFRVGERLDRSVAERMANELEVFERRIEIDRWTEETEEEKEMRFSGSENRMKLIWEAYEGLEWWKDGRSK
jgi:hypothetical protein